VGLPSTTIKLIIHIVFCIANIRLRFSHTCEYLLQNIRLEANIRESLSEFHIQVNIHLPLAEDPDP
jgi:hypothetical protein